MTLEELLEKETIKEIRVKYSHYFDGKMVDDLADLFCEDAVCEFGPDYGGDWVGKEAIRANFARYAEREGPPFGVLHAVTNPLITLIDTTTASGRWYLHDLNTQEGVDNPLYSMASTMTSTRKFSVSGLSKEQRSISSGLKGSTPASGTSKRRTHDDQCRKFY